MSRYVPSPDEQAAIDLLSLAGYTVVRQRTYDALHERVRIAECRRDMEAERRKSVEAWAQREGQEQRRLSDRLNRVCYAAAALGVSIQAINEALEATP